jgi:hypothetical protein
MQKIIRKRELVKHQLAEVRASAARFEGESERNGAAEKELHEKVKVK